MPLDHLRGAAVHSLEAGPQCLRIRRQGDGGGHRAEVEDGTEASKRRLSWKFGLNSNIIVYPRERGVYRMRSPADQNRQQEMYHRIEQVYLLTEEAVIDCPNRCDGRCETRMPETVLFLPYELEYILEKAGLAVEQNPFQVVTLPSGCYGMMDYHRHCPFLIPKACGIRPFRPLDCRSFPIYPRFSDSPEEHPEFFVSTYCPLKADLSSRYIDCIIEAWRILFPWLPPDWRAFYNSLGHYQERLLPRPD